MRKQQAKSFRYLIIATFILLLASGLRLSIFDYGLPFIESTDTSNFYMVVNDNRGLLDAHWRNDLLAGYPPGYLWLYARILDMADATGNYNVHIDGQYYEANTRLFSIFASLITLATIIALARLIGGRTASIIAGIVFAISAEVIELNVLSLPDPATTMFMSLSALISVMSFKKRSAFLALIATIVALIAIAFKYPVAPILLMPASFFLMDLWHRRIKALPSATLALIMVLATAYYLLYVNGGANFEIAETENFKDSLFDNLLSRRQWQATLRLFFDSSGIPILALTVISLLYSVVSKQKRTFTFEFWLLLATAIIMLGIVPLYLVRLESVRYVYPAVALFIVIFALTLPFLSRQLQGIAIAFILIWGLAESTTFINRLSLPYTFADAQFWAEDNLPDESVVWVESLFMLRSISRYEAGYSGFNNYGLMYAPVTEWETVAEFVDYVYLADYDLWQWRNDPARPSLDDMLLIKEIDNSGHYGPVIYVYDPQAPEHMSRIHLEDSSNSLTLHSYDIQQDNHTLQMKSYWQAPDSRPSVDYSYVLYLTPVDEPETILFQQDAPLGHRPTSTWDDPGELIRGNIGPFTIPDDLTEDSYHLRLGIYFWETGARMQFEDNGISLFLGEVRPG